MIDDLGPYPAYKESGVPWLGRVPAGWEMKRGKSLFAESQLADELVAREQGSGLAPGLVVERDETIGNTGDDY